MKRNVKDLLNSCLSCILVFLLLCPVFVFHARITLAQTSAPPPPERCAGVWDVWGLSGISSKYNSGAAIGGSLSYKISNNSDAPGALAQVLVGIVDQSGRSYGVTCIYDGNPRTCPDVTSGTGSFNLTAPTSPGTYYLIAAMDRHYSCSNARAQFPIQGDKKQLAAFQVNGEPPTPPEICKIDTSQIVRLNISPSGSGEVSFSPGSFQRPCKGYYSMAYTITLTATAYSGYVFDHWEGDARGSNSTTTISGKESYSVTAVFTPRQCSGIWDVWGLSGVSSRYNPGAAISGSLSYKISNNSDAPGALAQVLVGIVDQSGRSHGVTCIYDGNPRTCPDSTSGTGKFSLTAPSSPGTYSLVAAMDRHYSCSNAKANFPNQGDKKQLASLLVDGAQPESKDIKFRGTVTKLFLPDYEVRVEQILDDSTGHLEIGDFAWITAVNKSCVKGTIMVGDYVEVYAKPTGKLPGKPQGWLEQNHHYIRVISEDQYYTLTIRATDGGTTNPSPGTYKKKKGETVTITARQNTGCKFVEWGGDATGSSTSTTITMNESKRVTAYFNCEEADVTLTIRATDGGTTDPRPGTYNKKKGERVIISASPNSGCRFTGWGGHASGKDLTTTITMNESKRVTASFECEKKEDITLTIRATDGGTTNPRPGTYNKKKGERVTISANPNSGCRFTGWGGHASGTSTSTTITMDESKRVTASFECEKKEDITLTIRATDGGTTNPKPGTYNKKKGERVTISANPNSGCRFTGWGGHASGTSTSTTITMNESKRVTASFECEKACPNIISWSGEEWRIKSSHEERKGPGDNYWHECNVWRDQDGYLHLKIDSKDGKDGKWYCAEVWSTELFHFGTYTFEVMGNLQRLVEDKSVVLGLFNYDEDPSTPDRTNEIDIEFTRAWHPRTPIKYTVWPAKPKEDWRGEYVSSYYDKTSFDPGAKPNTTTWTFTWTEKEIRFESSADDADNEFVYRSTSTDDIPQNPMPVHINLWLHNGHDPQNGETEIIIKSFRYEKLKR